MYKIKFLAFIAVTAVFFACGSQESGSPPKLKNGRIAISPYDTLVAEFDSEIVDVRKLEEKIFFSQKDMIQVFPDTTQTSSKKLYFIGTYRTTPGNRSYFSNIINGSVAFLGLENKDGYVRNKDTLYFSTYPILDKELNDSEINANEITDEEIIFAGILDHKISQETGTIYDVEDYYKIKLKANDVLTITVSNFRDSLDITIKKPNGVKDTAFAVSKKKTNTFTYRVGLDYLLDDQTLTAADMVYFYIGISDNNISSPPNPYTIYVKRN
jgi:hypothetical protein